MLPTLREVMELPALRNGEPVVRAGVSALDEPVRWVHVSEISDIAGLLTGGELILTTGIALPESATALRRYVAELAEVGVCGLVVELGRRYRDTLPPALVAAADQAMLPLIELHRVTPFVAVTQAVHTLILDSRVRELVAFDERQQHRTLLTALALTTDAPADVAQRADVLGVPLHGRTLTGVAVRTVDGVADPALLRDIANRAADTLRTLRVPALVGLIDDSHVAVLLSQPDPDRVDAVLGRLSEQVHTLTGRRGGVALVVAAGVSVRTVERAATTVREAVRVCDSAAALAPGAGWFRAADLRLAGLVHELRDSPHLRRYVDRELEALLGHADADRLYDALAAYCRHGGSKTDAANALFVSRASLYDRLAKIERVLDVDLADPGVVLGLHFAVLAREVLAQPELAVRITDRPG